MIIGRGMAPGITEGEVLICNQTISPLGEMSKSGIIVSGPCSGKSFKDKILIFKGGRGSTVGSYVLLELKYSNNAPAGIINEEAEQVVLTGAIISEIPMIDKVPIDIFKEGDTVRMNGKEGSLDIANIVEKDVTTVYLIRENKILLLKRSDKVSTYREQYGGISGYMEKDETPEMTGKRELIEECGISDAKLLKKGKFVYVRNNDVLFRITPIIMKTDTEDIKLNWENSEYRWVNLEQMNSFSTVPKFKETFWEIYNHS